MHARKDRQRGKVARGLVADDSSTVQFDPDVSAKTGRAVRLNTIVKLRRRAVLLQNPAGRQTLRHAGHINGQVAGFCRSTARRLSFTMVFSLTALPVFALT